MRSFKVTAEHTILFLSVTVTGLFFAACLSAAPPAPVNPAWKNSQQIVRVPDRLQTRSRSLDVHAGSVSLQGLKAVLIAGPIDGDSGSWTIAEIKNLKLAASVLRANNVQVFEFYTPRNNWDEIKKAAAGAHFLLYRGHGVYDGNTPPGWVGGFSLKDHFVSSDDIRQDLKLAPGAIVMLYGCFTAGNSGFDLGRIDQKEAKRRVAMYSLPFLQTGASAYYADWFGDAFASFLTSLFDGQTLGDAYQSYSDFNASTVSYGAHPDLPAQQMWIDHDVWDGKTVYNFAFVGQPGKTLRDLFAASPVEPSPGNDPIIPRPPVVPDGSEGLFRNPRAH